MSDSTKCVVINKEARKIVVQRKPPAAVIPTKVVGESQKDEQEQPIVKKSKLEPETIVDATKTVQQKLSALERLKSLNFSAPKSAVNPFSLTTTSKSSTLEIRQNDQHKKTTDVLPIITSAPLKNFPPTSDSKPKPLFDNEKNNIARFFEPNYVDRPVRPSFPLPHNDARQFRSDFIPKLKDFTSKSPPFFCPNVNNSFAPRRRSKSPPFFAQNVNDSRFDLPMRTTKSPPNFNAHFGRFPHSNEQQFTSFSSRSIHSPPIFNPNDVWLNPIYVQKNYLEKEKLENLQISEADLNSLSVVGLKNTVEYLLEIESDLIDESSRLNAQITTVQRALDTCPRFVSNSFEHLKQPKTKKIANKSSVKEKIGSKTIPSTISDENFTKALFKAINDQAEARKKEMNYNSTLDDRKHNVGEFTSKEFEFMAMAKIFFAGMSTGLLEKTNSDSNTY